MFSELSVITLFTFGPQNIPEKTISSLLSGQLGLFPKKNKFDLLALLFFFYILEKLEESLTVMVL